MRIRLLAALAVVAAALLVPSAAFAVTAPDIFSPVSGSATSSSAVTLEWDPVGGEGGYRVFRADGNCSASFANISDLTGGDLAVGSSSYPDTLSSEGSYCYKVEAFAGLATADSSPVLVTYDHTQPTGPMPTPFSGSKLPAPVHISVSASDAGGSGIASVQLSSAHAGIGDWTSITSAITSAPYDFDWSPPDGTYDIQALITDRAGNTLTTTNTGVLVDSTPPDAPAAPSGLTPVNSAPAITFSATSDPSVNGVASGVGHYDIYRDGSRVNVSGIPAGGQYAWSDVAGQSTSPASGSNSYVYRVVAVDVAGNESAASGAQVILMDTAAPTTPVAPSGTSPVSAGPAIAITPTTDPGGVLASGVDHYDVYRDGSQVNVSAIPAGGPYGWSDVLGQSSNPASGSHSYAYAVRAVDAAGNVSVQSPARTILMDTAAPTTPVAPSATSPVSAGPAITITPTTDPGGVLGSGIDHYDVYRDATKVNVSAIPAGGPYTWNDVGGQSSPPASGSHSYAYTIVAVDAAGNSSAQSPARTILMDTAAPTIPAAPAGASPVSTAPAVTITPTTDPGGVLASGVDHYDVYRDGSKVNVSAIPAGGPYGWSDVGGQSSTPASGSHSYAYTVVAVDVAGNPSAQSPARTILMDTAAPTTPVAPSGTSPVSAGPAITIAPTTDPGGVLASGVDHYDVYRDGSKVNVSAIPAGGPYTWSDVAGQSSPAASGSHNYSYTVVAIDAAGNPSAQSAARVILMDTFAPTAPSAPTGFHAVISAPTITFSTTTVTDPPSNGVQSGVDHYDVYRDGAKVNASPILDTLGVTSYTWSDTGPASLNPPTTPLHTYSYIVKTVDKAGNPSPASSPLLILLDPNGTSAPTSVTVLASPTNQHPQISWAAPAAPGFTVHHYQVLHDGVATDVPGTVFTDGTASEGAHIYQVVAADATNSTLGSASASVTIVYDTTAPLAPTGATAAAALDGSIAISWVAANDGAGSGVARYVVRRSLSSTPPVSVSDGDATCQGAVTSCSDATTLNGKLYSYAVFAIDRAGNTSLAGNTAAVTARDQLAPSVPTGLSATPGDASVALAWNGAGPNDDVAGYVLVAKQGSQAPANETDGTRVCAAIVSTSSNCAATGLTNGATYTFGLFALDEALNRSQPALVSSAPNGKVDDVTAPAAVSKLIAKVSGHTVTLSWKNPADRDFDHVEITAGARKPAALKASKRVYSGKGTQAKTTLAAGQSRWFVVVAYDAVGNASAPASVHVAIASASRFGPTPRAKVHGKVRLSWPVKKGAKYYNVQVFAGKKRILVAWPTGRAFQLPRAKLKRGTTYTWYIWPGLGAKAKAHYGKLIGKNAFTFTG
ncbi:MAG TPA: hypothetical protein VFD90_16730 [Gaiellales bacterium]|nr:hypothetical protein [Gaiellales bacterium]